MGLINNLIFLADTVAPTEVTHFIGRWIVGLQNLIGNYGWTVVIFTLVLKLVMSPLDIWQRVVMYKNNKIMKRMQPQLAKLQKQYGANQQLFQQKQMELFKKEKYSAAGACLPMIISIVVFFIVFAGFNATTTYQAATEYVGVRDTWNDAYIEAKNDYADTLISLSEQEKDLALRSYDQEFVAVADQAVRDSYKPTSWLWIRNVFMPDNWSEIFPSYETFVGNGLGQLRVNNTVMEVDREEYERVTNAIRSDLTGWNGFLILPVLSIVLSFLGQYLSKASNPQQKNGNASDDPTQMSGQMMQIMMPLLMGFFALSYSATFTIYMVVSNIFSLLLQIGFNVAQKISDKREEDYRLEHTIKY